MPLPLVSVLIPARNAERWIGDAIESALAQSWPALEVLVAEAGSSDGTRAVVARLASARVRLLPDAGSTSAAANRNRAAREAQGEYLQYLDADDLINPDKIRLQAERLAGDNNAVAMGEWARFYRAVGEARFEPEPVWADMESRTWLRRAWSGGQPMMQPGLWLVPRTVAEAAGPWDESLSLIDDFDYFTRVLLASRRVCFCEGARLYYRSGNPESLASRRSPEAWRSAWRSLDQGTRAFLAGGDEPAERSACADLFQQLAYDAYLEDAEIAHQAEDRAAALGGSSIVMSGGTLFRLVRNAAGWKAAKRVKRAFYRLGYRHVARTKETVMATVGSR